MANEKTMNVILQLRNGAASTWETSTYELKTGEIGIAVCSDGKRRFKIGEGNKLWSALPYVNDGHIYASSGAPGTNDIKDGDNNLYNIGTLWIAGDDSVSSPYRTYRLFKNTGSLNGATWIEVPTVNSNVASASKLAQKKTFKVTGDATTPASPDNAQKFDGTDDVTLNITLADSGVDAGTYTKVKVDSKGRVTEGESLAPTDLPVATNTALGAIKIGANLDIVDGLLSATALQQPSSSNKFPITAGSSPTGSWAISSDPSQGKYVYICDGAQGFNYTDVNYSAEVVQHIGSNASDYVYVQAPCRIVKNKKQSRVEIYSDSNDWGGFLILTSGGENDSQQSGHEIFSGGYVAGQDPLPHQTGLRFTSGVKATNESDQGETEVGLDLTVASSGSGNAVTSISIDNDTGKLTATKGGTFIPSSEKGANNGIPTLNEEGKIPLTQISDSILGQVEYKGTWSASSNNNPTLPTTPTEKGVYYVVRTAGTRFDIEFDVGDWIISDGTKWDKVDNTDAVTLVNGQKGDVVLDYTHVGAAPTGHASTSSTTYGSATEDSYGHAKAAKNVSGEYPLASDDTAAGNSGLLGAKTNVFARADHKHPRDTGVLHLTGTQTVTGSKTFSGAVSFTGTTTSATPDNTSNNTTIATTAFVKAVSATSTQGGYADSAIQTVKVNNVALSKTGNSGAKEVDITAVTGIRSSGNAGTFSKGDISLIRLDTTKTTSLSTNSTETLLGTGTIQLHKISKTGSASDILAGTLSNERLSNTVVLSTDTLILDGGKANGGW